MIFLSGPMTSPMITTPRQVITTHSNSSEGKGAPWTQREMSSFWLSRSNQMGHATPLTPPGAKERQQSCRLILDFISTQHFTDVFMSLIRMVLYQQSFFPPQNILQTSVTHIQSDNERRRRTSFWEGCDGAGWPAGWLLAVPRWGLWSITLCAPSSL